MSQSSPLTTQINSSFLSVYFQINGEGSVVWINMKAEEGSMLQTKVFPYRTCHKLMECSGKIKIK